SRCLPGPTAASPSPMDETASARPTRLRETDNSQLTAVLRPPGRPRAIQRFRRVGRDLQVRAVMVGVPTGVVERVFGHELDHLQRALLAVDVRELHVRLERLHLTRGSCRVDEEAVGQYRDLWWILNRSCHR